MIDYAQEHHPNPLIRYSRGEIDDLTTLDADWVGSFDFLTCFMVLHWVTDQEQGLANIHALLKPGGEMLLALGTGAPPSFLKMAGALQESERWKEYLEVSTELSFVVISLSSISSGRVLSTI